MNAALSEPRCKHLIETSETTLTLDSQFPN